MVPNGWSENKLFTLCEKIGVGLAISVTPYMRNTGTKLIRNQNIKRNFFNTKSVVYIDDDFADKNKSKKVYFGDVVAVRTGSNIGEACVVPKEFSGALTFTTLIARPISSKLSSEFLGLHINSERGISEVNRLMAGGGKPNLNSGELKNYSLLTPPLPEQHKIAKTLGTWDKAISTTEHLIDNSKQQKKALMQQLLTGAHKGKRLLDGSGKPFEGEWEKVIFDDCIKHTGGTALEKHVIDDAKHHFISIGNYAMDGKYIDKGQRIALNNKTKTKLLNKNDLVMVLNDKTKTGDIIGATILIDEDDKYIYNQRSERITLNEGINALFFWFLLNSSHFRTEVFSRSQGGTQIYVNFGALKTIYFNLPSNKEQQKISLVLINADKEIGLLEQQLADLKQEKKALMQQLLTGKRRVKIDEGAA